MARYVFTCWRGTAAGLTDVTRTFFKKLVEQIERGFDKMSEQYAGRVEEPAPAPAAAPSADGAGPSKGVLAAAAQNKAARLR